jgi:hypothetical protein
VIDFEVYFVALGSEAIQFLDTAAGKVSTPASLDKTAAGGAEPLWSRNGKQFYYRRRLNQVWVVDVQTGPSRNWADG